MGVIGAAGGLAAALLAGCTADEDHRDVPAAKTGPVTACGLTLDENATPQQVTYVLLRSFADDVEASQAHDKTKQKEALRTTHSLLAFKTIEQRLLQVENLSQGKKPRESLGDERDIKLYDFARQLAPIVAHYIRSFDQDFAAASGKMRLLGNPQTGVVHIHYEAAHDPAASELTQRDPVIINVELVKESADGKSYWRVARVAFAGRPSGVGTATRGAVPREMTVPATVPSR